MTGDLLGPHDPQKIKEAVHRKGFYAGPALGNDPCSRCHPDVSAQWTASAHRFASFNNPYYAAVADVFRREEGDGAFRFCANCHDPLLTQRVDPVPKTASEPAAQAGITCIVCHSVDTPPPVEGNGLYTAHLRPVPLGPGHSERVKPAPLSTAQFCGSCHKVGLLESVTGDRWFRGQNEFDGWRDSAWSGRGVAVVQRPSQTRTCVDCHMPRVPAPRGDKGAKKGLVRDHRFLGANTALAHARGDDEQVKAIDTFLSGVVSLAFGQTQPGLVDIVMVNRKVGHPFPGGVNDSNEAWLQWTLTDAEGHILDRGGHLDADGNLQPAAYRFRAQSVNAMGHPLPRRGVQHHRGVAYDTRLPPHAPRAVRLQLPTRTTRLEVSLRYRQHSPSFAAFACNRLPATADMQRCLTPPVTVIAEATVAVDPQGKVNQKPHWRRRLEHGLALTSGLARHAHEATALLDALIDERPKDIEPLIAAAMAAAKLGRTDTVIALSRKIDALGGASPARYFVEAKALTRAFRHGPARTAAENLLERVPDDRQALALAAKLRGLDGDAKGALAAALTLTRIDPEDPRGWLQLSLAQRDLGQPDDAARARWLRHRVDRARNVQLRTRLRAQWPRLAERTEPLATLNAQGQP